MSAHTYNLRNRVNSPAARPSSAAGTPRSSLRPLKKPHPFQFSLRLDHVIGTTSKNPGGLSACEATNTFAYCAGSVAVLAEIKVDDTVTYRYYRARPAAVPISLAGPYYETPTHTPTRKATGLISSKKDFGHITPTRNVVEDGTARTWTARERIKTATCVALSPDGRWLAVGETGYNPRVLLFSTAKDATTDIPVSVVTDHTWGVRCVAFSSDSKYLATLGDMNDGFVFVWAVSSRSGSLQLIATNKCTTNICHMAWCGHQLVTAGTRHIKVWQVPYQDQLPSTGTLAKSLLDTTPMLGPVPLAGRNCLLGDLVDSTFVCITVIDPNRVFVLTDEHVLCLIDLNDGAPLLTKIEHNLAISGSLFYRERTRRLVWTGGGEASLNDTDITEVLEKPVKRPAPSRLLSADQVANHCVVRKSSLRESLGVSRSSGSKSCALVCLADHTILIDKNSNLHISGPSNGRDSDTPARTNEPIQGVRALPDNAGLGAFFTWSKSGQVQFWKDDANLLRVEQVELSDSGDNTDPVSNELKILEYCPHGHFLSGDRFGVLKWTNASSWQTLDVVRAHSTEINDIAVDKQSSTLATCSRDRLVQVFGLQGQNFDLIQTMDDHIAAVNQVLFDSSGGILLSCSADRTIVVREKALKIAGQETLFAFLQTRIITVKAAPLAMCLRPSSDDVLYVSTLDRHIMKINYHTGITLDAFKTTEPDSDDTAVIGALQAYQEGEDGARRVIIVGCSSTDKSIRAYDTDQRQLLTKESAHTEGVSDVAILESHQAQKWRRCVSTGHDSTIMLWTAMYDATNLIPPAIEVTQDDASLLYDSDVVPAKVTPAALPPLRKMLTKLDVAEFVKLPSARSREPSPVRLTRKSSKLGLASTTIAEIEESSVPKLMRQVSADDPVEDPPRSPSPPSYATKRIKKPALRADAKDFFSRQSEWLPQSASPEELASVKRPEQKANKARLRRPPSVPTDLRGKANEYGSTRRSSLASSNLDTASISVATDQTCRVLKEYRSKLMATKTEINLDDIEEELTTLLGTIRKRKVGRRGSTVAMTNRTRTARQKLDSTASSSSPEPVPNTRRTLQSNTASPKIGQTPHLNLNVDGRTNHVLLPNQPIDNLSRLLENSALN